MSSPRVTIKKVLISDACDSACATLLEKNGIEVQSKYKLSTDALIAELKVFLINNYLFNMTYIMLYITSNISKVYSSEINYYMIDIF